MFHVLPNISESAQSTRLRGLDMQMISCCAHRKSQRLTRAYRSGSPENAGTMMRVAEYWSVLVRCLGVVKRLERVCGPLDGIGRETRTCRRHQKGLSWGWQHVISHSVNVFLVPVVSKQLRADERRQVWKKGLKPTFLKKIDYKRSKKKRLALRRHSNKTGLF